MSLARFKATIAKNKGYKPKGTAKSFEGKLEGPLNKKNTGNKNGVRFTLTSGMKKGK